jgi:hypothetical protein
VTGHLDDRDLLLHLDGEATGSLAEEIEQHLAGCAACRQRSAELAQASQDFAAEYQAIPAPPVRNQSQALSAKLNTRGAWQPVLLAAAAAVALAVALRWHEPPATGVADAPLPKLTPGATRAISREAVCAGGPELQPVAGEVAREVFRRYGIESPVPRTYEIDYLIPPDLGGSDDPRNLWPQPYAGGVWNSRVKDALEDRLRALVCSGQMDLQTAQQEMARDWIAAYKRHFRTEKPLLDHVAFYKDKPWE